ncbi:hypothetical protein B0T18DRAFT_228386 [Schizothecium vesticola]|uniref:Uncharacterized protein n=1 Tax=Schizothecium vesticola TaxID=314040 RepID=A0AA40EL18_9PEZI|nr:hypothetical protein B0T18DRAFT_228386 [Schizothecium vesticola]
MFCCATWAPTREPPPRFRFTATDRPTMRELLNGTVTLVHGNDGCVSHTRRDEPAGDPLDWTPRRLFATVITLVYSASGKFSTSLSRARATARVGGTSYLPWDGRQIRYLTVFFLLAASLIPRSQQSVRLALREREDGWSRMIDTWRGFSHPSEEKAQPSFPHDIALTDQVPNPLVPPRCSAILAEYVCMGSCWVRHQTDGRAPTQRVVSGWCLGVKQVLSVFLLASCLSAGSDISGRAVGPGARIPNFRDGAGHVDQCLLVINIDTRRASWRGRCFIGVSLTVV